jgi:hypothetical protein
VGLIRIDGIQVLSRDLLEKLMPVFVDSRVALNKQPFPARREALLDGFQSTIPSREMKEHAR